MKRALAIWAICILMSFLVPVLRYQPRLEPSNPTGTTELFSQTDTQPSEDGVWLKVLMQDGTVSELELEDYLVGVVLGEMPASFEMEALKAQAVVARTFTLRRGRDSKHENAQICTDSVCCQSWISRESYLEKAGANTADWVDRVEQAVRSTAGKVLTYRGELIDATYFSCSGGRTEAAAAVWGGEIPYLQSVDSPGEESAAHFTDQVIYGCPSFAAKLMVENVQADFSGDPEGWFGPVTLTEGGGVERMVLGGVAYSGTTLRRVLGLRSTAFTMELEGDHVVITTHGFGHRVGMSQYGAQAMAESGSSYAEILTHYYTGTELTSTEAP